MDLKNCTSLRSLPKLPISIVEIWGDGCTSLEKIPDLQKPNSLCNAVLWLTNCTKLADNQNVIDMFFVVIRTNLQGLSRHGRCDIRKYNWRYDMIITRSVIPKWFIHQSVGAELNIKEPSSHLCDEWMGTAVCVLFSSPPLEFSLDCQLIANGKVMSTIAAILGINYDIVGLSDKMWLFYLFAQYYEEEDIKLLNECEANELSQIGIKIETRDSSVEVKKCGFCMVYKNDIEELNRIMAQSSNTSIIPYEDFGVLHHNFDNSTVVVEDNKAKQLCDDFDGAGPGGEGSSNDVPHPNRIERLSEFMPHGDSDCEEYFECGEEISD
nr:hypothetical protein CFP56_51862 [Quercus suber]